jgi:chromosome segregation ATPase
MPAPETLEELFDKMDAENEHDAIQAMLTAPASLIDFPSFADRIEASPLLIRKAICNAIRLIDANTSEERINAFLAVRKLLAAGQLDWTTIARALQHYADLTEKLDRLKESSDDHDSTRKVNELSQTLEEQSWKISALEDTTSVVERSHYGLKSDHGNLKSDHDGLQWKHDRLQSDHNRLQSDHERLNSNCVDLEHQLNIRFSDLLPEPTRRSSRLTELIFTLVVFALALVTIAFCSKK